MLKTRIRLSMILCGLASVPGYAGSPADTTAPTLIVQQVRANEFFRIRVEKTNGFDVRENVMPGEVIHQLEGEGKQVRPHGTADFVTYWALMKDGSYVTMDNVNDPDKARLSYAQLEATFRAAPRAGVFYARDQAGPGSLAVGTLIKGTKQLDPKRAYIYKMLKARADNTKLGCKKGDVVIYLVNPQNPEGPGLYYFVADYLPPPVKAR